MSKQRVGPYEFASDLPLNGIEPGTNLLVAGPTMGGARRLALRLVADATDRGEGMLLVSTDKGSRKVLSECDGLCTDLERSPVGVVDCVSSGSGRGQFADSIETVSSPGDLTGIGIGFSGLYQNIHQSGTERVRAGLYSISTLLMYADFQTVSRFIHTVSGRIAATNGLGVFLIDPATQDEKVVSTMTQLCDAKVDVRERDDGGSELRVRGLRDQPRDWTPF